MDGNARRSSTGGFQGSKSRPNDAPEELLAAAIYTDNTRMVRELIRQNPYMVNAPIEGDNFALHLAAMRGNLQVAEDLVAEGAAIDALGKVRRMGVAD